MITLTREKIGLVTMKMSCLNFFPYTFSCIHTFTTKRTGLTCVATHSSTAKAIPQSHSSRSMRAFVLLMELSLFSPTWPTGAAVCSLLIFAPADIYKVWTLMSQADYSVNSRWTGIRNVSHTSSLLSTSRHTPTSTPESFPSSFALLPLFPVLWRPKFTQLNTSRGVKNTLARLSTSQTTFRAFVAMILI